MRAVPKPATSKSGPTKPKLTEEDFLEISDKIAEAIEFKTEVEITLYFQKKFEEVVGVITNADSQTGKLSLSVNHDSVKIDINSIVNVK